MNDASSAIPGIRIGKRVKSVTNCAQVPETDQSTTNVLVTQASSAACTAQDNVEGWESYDFTAPEVTWDGATMADKGLRGTAAAAAYTSRAVTRFNYAVGDPLPTTSNLTALTAATGANAAVTLTWGAASVCDTAKWDKADSCAGIAGPWGKKSAMTFPKGDGTTIAKGSWYRWLADNVTDRKAQFSVEKDDTIKVLVYEKWGKAPLNNDSGNPVGPHGSTIAGLAGYDETTTPADGYLCATETVNWGVHSFTVTGAMTLAAGASALIAATLF